MPAVERPADTVPTSNPNHPATILEAETNALAICLKNAVVKTGQICAFHADTRKLGIRKYSPCPPLNLTASLGRELEKYDQLCDTIETHLLRAISVLKRDLAREERRAREAEMVAMAAKSASRALTADTTMLPPPAPGQGSPLGSVLPARRQSAISLSSLHRHPFPLKLDLSSSMRMTAEDVALFSKGLVHSPVSLAPKSARPTSTADIDLMAAFASAAAANPGAQHVDIDLTVDDSPPSMMAGVNTSLGSSADKPIELDLDSIDMQMTDLFGDDPGSSTGDGQASMDELFTPPTADAGVSLSGGDGSHPKGAKQDDSISMGILDALTVDDGNHEAHLFAAMQGGTISSGDQVNDGSQQAPQGGNVTASPRSLLASFTNQSQLDPGGEHMATFDLSTLDFPYPSTIFGEQSSDGGIMDMEALLSMHHTTDNSDLQRPSS